MSYFLSYFIAPLAAYLIGSISSAILVSRLFSLDDPRESGSGNPGATNVLRSGNKLAAALTLVGDLLKGAIPVLIAQQIGLAPPVVALVCIAAFMGHLWPIFFSFKGGKGVATAVGVFAALSIKLFLVFAAIWLLTAVLSRYSSLAALMAAAITGLASFAMFDQANQIPIVGAVFWIVAFLFQRHRDNIDRLRSGTESKIGVKS